MSFEIVKKNAALFWSYNIEAVLYFKNQKPKKGIN